MIYSHKELSQILFSRQRRKIISWKVHQLKELRFVDKILRTGKNERKRLIVGKNINGGAQLTEGFKSQKWI